MKGNRMVYTLITLLALIGISVAIPFGGAIALAAVGCSALASVLTYVLFSKVNKKQTEKEKQTKPFLNIYTQENNVEPTKEFKNLHSADKIATFKGNHKVQKENEIKEDDFTL